MRKKIVCLLTAAALSLGTALPALAEDHKSTKDWQVTFDGSKMGTNFSPADMAEEIYTIQPGDSMQVHVALKNSAGRATSWYMANEVLSTLEESQETAQGGAYTYRLTYVGPGGAKEVLYSSEAVGGENSDKKAGEGLHQATSSLEDYFFLDTLGSGQGGMVYLTVKLDGESQGNDYQDTLAKLQMSFAVENAPDPDEITVTPTPRSIVNTVRRVLDQDTPTTIVASVKTNDPTQILPYCAAALIAGILLLILGGAAMKRRRAGQEEEHDEEGGSRG